MTQDEIIETAVKAGMHIDVLTLGRNVDLLERFAKLVARHAKAEEREACARVCETLRHQDYVKETYEWISATNNCADAIRERGQVS